MTDLEKKILLEAVDIVCLECICGNDEVCKDCPVRKTVDKLINEENEG